MHRCTRIIEFDAAHRLVGHETKCANIHGHRYKVEITVEAPELDTVGRVVDFSVIKSVVGEWIDDKLDHTMILYVKDSETIEFVRRINKKPPYIMQTEPTAENIASVLLSVADSLIRSEDEALRVVQIRLWETPNCFADARLGRK